MIYFYILELFLILVSMTGTSVLAKSILITGSSGFVGSALLEAVLQNDLFDEIYLPVRNYAKLNAYLDSLGSINDPRIKIIEIYNQDFSIRGLNIDYVVHASGVVAADSYEAYRKVNVDMTLKLMEQLSGNEKIIILSSLAANGPSGIQGVNENQIGQPISFYGRSKLEMELTVMEKFPSYNFVFLRPPMVLGSGDIATISLLKHARSYWIIKPGITDYELEHWYSFIDSRDLATGIIKMLSSDVDFKMIFPRHLYIADQQNFTSYKLFSTARDVVNGNGKIVSLSMNTIRWISFFVEKSHYLRDRNPNLRKDRVEDAAHSWKVCASSFENMFDLSFKTGLKNSLNKAWSDYNLKN